MAPTKMTVTASKQGFTLVELIVVITILAILGTIGFISLQGYSAQSRDSKRTSDLRSLSTAVSTKSTEGISLINIITADGNRDINTPSFGGTGATLGTNYQAGTPNTTVLAINADAFKDPSALVPYSIGSTTKSAGAFQLAAKMEWGGTNTTLLSGNFNSRTRTLHTLSATAATAATTVSLPTTAAWFYRVGDTLTGTGLTVNTTVSKISGDTLTLTLSAPTTASVTAVELATTESTSLLWTSTWAALVNNGTLLPY
jgi:prepilin-type N-terminal cleavage/methylation domain-containing protein